MGNYGSCTVLVPNDQKLLRENATPFSMGAFFISPVPVKKK